jgi:hypothetical protein
MQVSRNYTQATSALAGLKGLEVTDLIAGKTSPNR